MLILQVGFVFYQATTNEALLKNGTSVKVKLAPVDPRSMLQGDYVQLRYDISMIPDLQKTTHQRERVKVVLRENNQGVYEYAGYVHTQSGWNKPYHRVEGDVLLNGRFNGQNEIVFGTETYFVQEGKGIKLQRDVKYAYLKVGETGNAILVRIE